MEELWNDFSLKKPPFLTLSAKHSPSVLRLHTVIDAYISRYVKIEQDFNESAALLSRLMCRRKNSFNKMKGFKDVCKLNAALSRLLRVDFMRDLDVFRNTLPDVEYDEGTSVQLPTRENFDFLLIRLISLHELYKRIIECCTSSADYFTRQINLYFFFEINTLFLAVMAKIHSMSTKLLNNVAYLYNNSLQHRLSLPVNVKSKFLKNIQFEFPNILDVIKLIPQVHENIADNGQTLKDLLQQEEKLTVVKATKLKKADTGTQIERASKPLENSFNIEKLNSVEEIKRFIAKESKSRSINLKSSVTTKILNHEWAGATKLFERKVQGGDPKKAVNIFRKFLCSKIL